MAKIDIFLEKQYKCSIIKVYKMSSIILLLLLTMLHDIELNLDLLSG